MRIEIYLAPKDLALAERLCAEENAKLKAEGREDRINLNDFLGALASTGVVMRLRDREALSPNREEAPVLSAAQAAAD